MNIAPETWIVDSQRGMRLAKELKAGDEVLSRRGGSWATMRVKKAHVQESRSARIVRTRSGRVVSSPDALLYCGTPPRPLKTPHVGDLVLLSDGGANLYVERIDMIEYVEMADESPMIFIELMTPGNLVADGLLLGPWLSH